MGNQITRRSASGKLANLSYDKRSRVTLLDWSDSTPDVAYACDAAGRVLSASSSERVLTCAYDDAGELLSEEASGTTSAMRRAVWRAARMGVRVASSTTTRGTGVCREPSTG